MTRKKNGRALTGPPSDRMMRSGLDLVEVAECEECKVIMPTYAVAAHNEQTGHGTYNRKLVSRNEYRTRIGGPMP